MKAYLGKAELKEMMVEEVKKHQLSDKIRQGSYGDSDGPWCAVGCSIQSLNVRLGKNIARGDHGAYETELGIPRIIARLEDRIFEGLGSSEAKEFPLKFIEAVNVGADLSMVWPKLAVWLLVDDKDGVLKYARNDRQREAITKVADLYKKVIAGEAVEKAEWKSAAADAAADAAAAYAAAAYADADAAAAAYAADAAAADAAAAYAAAAYAAADAAADAAAAYAARRMHFSKCANKLIEILKETK